ncbi:MAG: T9SS type A sorting domain-containing protein [Saprospiraceae bacterium]
MRYLYLLVIHFSLFYFSNQISAQCGWVGNMNYPGGPINEGGEYLVYIQVYQAGVTEASGQGSGINCYVYFGSVPSFGGDWSDIQTVEMTYHSDSGNNDVYVINIGPYLHAGLYEYSCYGVCSGSSAQNWQIGSDAQLTVNASAPVKFGDIKVTPTSKGNLINWTTLSEANSDFFEIQFSTNGTVYNNIGEVKCHGNTNVEQQYEFIHHTDNNSNGFYRLKQIDFDGKYFFSNVVIVRHIIKTQNQQILYPNPTSDFVQVNGLSVISSFKIINTSGSTCISGTISTNEPLNISMLDPGLYNMVIENDSSFSVLRFLKI